MKKGKIVNVLMNLVWVNLMKKEEEGRKEEKKEE